MYKLQVNRNRKSIVSRSSRIHNFNNSEKDKRAAELVLANIELNFQNEERELRASELIFAHQKLLGLYQVGEKNHDDLRNANAALIFQIGEKEKTEQQLIIANTELNKAHTFQKEYIAGLEKMIYMISHEVRQPIAQVLGLAQLLEKAMNSTKKVRVLVDYMKKSALTLDVFTRSLTRYVSQLIKKGKYVKPRN